MLLLIVLALVALQTLLLALWIWRETSDRGIVIRVPAAPLDPRDFLRGQYLRLTYRFEDSRNYQLRDADEELAAGQPVFAVLAYNEETGLFEPLAYGSNRETLVARLRKTMDSEEFGNQDYDAMARRKKAVMIKGVCSAAGMHPRFQFGADRLFVEEGTAEPPMHNAVARLFVADTMRLRVEGLEIDGAPWIPEPALPSHK